MNLAYIGYAMIVVLMALIISKRMSAFAALIIVPLAFGAVACAVTGTSFLEMGDFIKDSTKSMANNFSMIFFAIVFFGIMISTGLFDPLVNLVVRLVKGDPLKVMVGTSILTACVALDGDGTITYIICCTAMLPVFTRLNMNKLYMAVAMVMQVTIMNNLPWGGPTSRIIVVCDLAADELAAALAPGMIAGVIFNVAVSAFLGMKERKRLGIVDVVHSQQAIEMTAEEKALRRPKLVPVNLVLTVAAVVIMITGIFPANATFGTAAALALAINYRSLKDQQNMIQEHGSESIQVISLILAAGVLMGVLNGTGISDAMAIHMTQLVPPSLGNHFPIITAVISCFGTFFLSNDAFYYGVLPLLAEAGYSYGFSPMTMGVAAAMGQAFHLISPLVGSLYVITQLSGESVTSIQGLAAKWGAGLFVVYVVVAMAQGLLPI